MIIRKVKKEDAENVSELLCEMKTGKHETPKIKKTVETYGENPDYIYICAEENGKITGVLTGIVCHSLLARFSPFMVLENMVVSEAKQRRSIGKALISEMEKAAKKSNCKEIIVPDITN